MASITKIVTALVVLDAHPLAPGEPGPGIPFGPADVGFYDKYLAAGGKVAWVSDGMVLSQHDTLRVVLLESANNYAESLAAWAFGSEAEYVVAADAWLTARGLGAVTVVDSNGLSPQNTAPASALVELGRLALQHPVVAELVATADASVPHVGAVDNTNLLLGVDGVDGIKTGTLDEAGACLLFSADREVAGEPVTLVGVALGAGTHEQLRADVLSLLDTAEAGFRERELADAGQVVGEYTTEWGQTVDVAVAEDATAVLWADTPATALVSTEPLLLGEAGDDIGELSITAGDETVEVALELSDDVTEPGPWWRLANPLVVLF